MIHDFGMMGGTAGGTGADHIRADTSKDILMFQDKGAKYYFHFQWTRTSNTWWYCVKNNEFELIDIDRTFEAMKDHIPDDKKAYAVWTKYNPNI